MKGALGLLLQARAPNLRRMTDAITIVKGTEAVRRRQAIFEQLAAFNLSQVPSQARPLCVAQLADDGNLLAGLYGTMLYDWLAIELLFVPDGLRDRGLGSRLVAEAEAEAQAAGCIGSWLDTFSFQARGFYEKLGYSVTGTIPDHPRGGARFFMMKRWREA